MKKILQFQKIIANLFVLVLFFQYISPIVIIAQNVNQQNIQKSKIEILTENDKDGKVIVKKNPDYVDPLLNKISIPKAVTKPTNYTISNVLDNNAKITPVTEAIKNSSKQKSVNLEDAEERKKNFDELSSKAKENKEKNTERRNSYKSDNGTEIVKQSLGINNVKLNNKFETATKLEDISNSLESKIEQKVSQLKPNFKDIVKSGITLNTEGGQVNFKALNANNSKPIKNNNSVLYKDVWKDVDVEYTVDGASVKENIIIKKYTSSTKFQFEVSGAKLSNSKDVVGGIDMKIGNYDMYIDPLFILAKDLGPIVDKEVGTQIAQNNKIVINIDQSWLKSLKPENFPVTIDPGVTWGSRKSGSNYKSYVRNGTWNAEYNTQFSIGSTRLTNGTYNNWRAVSYMDYNEINGKNLLGAYINFPAPSYSLSPFSNVNINIKWANCLGFDCVNNASPVSTGTIGQNGGNIDIYNTLKWLKDNNISNGWFIYTGTENTGNTFRQYNPSNLSLNYATNLLPNNNASLVIPQNGQVITNTNQILRINPATDPDNDVLEYNFQLIDQTGTIIQSSGYTGSTSMTIMDGLLQDSQTYTWRVWVKDTYYSHPTPAFTSTFKVDYRLGKDSSQTYDNIGPLSVNIQTGNAYMSAGTHSIAALGGSIGINLEYNSPTLTKEGLSARYWNNTNFSGEPSYTRIDSNIDFNWSLGSPAPGIINVDKFAVAWSGYFIAPQTGNFKLGMSADDNVTLYSGNSTLLTRTCCGEIWSGNIYLTEGQAYPISINYSDLGGSASVELYFESPNGARNKVQSNMLRTNPIPVGYNRGLTGHYYFDNGNHDFAQNQQKFLTRNEPVISFDWGLNSPVNNGPTDNFLVRFEGYVTVPTTGNYQFIVGSDDGTRLWVNNQNIIDRWINQGYTDTTSISQYLVAGQFYPIKLEYFEGAGGAAVSLKWNGPAGLSTIDNKYLSPEPNILPVGWKLAGVTGVPFDSLKVRSNGDVILSNSDGSESLYGYTSGGYKPPVNEDAWLVKNQDNTYTLTDTAGGIYIFASLDNSGSYKIRETSNPYDDKNPAGLKYEYTNIGGVNKLRRIIDGVDSSRFGTIYYKGDSQCNEESAHPAPAGYLCAFGTTDGRTTYFHYWNGQGLLNNIIQPGNSQFHISYLSDGKVNSMRDSSMLDPIYAGLRNGNESGSSISLNYDMLGRVVSSSLPSVTGASQIQHSIEYLPNKSKQHIIAPGYTEPNGFSKYVEYDNLFRTTKVCDLQNLCATTEWDSIKDVILSTTNALGHKSTTIYDADDRPLESYGPAPLHGLEQIENHLQHIQHKYPK